MNTLFAPLDIYCERLAPGLAGEPLNAISNLAFFVAAYLLFDDMRRAKHYPREIWGLTGLVALIAAGSTLFHTFANRLTSLFDIIPIGIFILSYFSLLLMRLYRFSLKKAAAGTALFLGFTGLLGAAFTALGASIIAAYVSSMLLLWGFAIDLERRKHAAAREILIAALLFSLSLTLRSLDVLACEALPIGTHFCWHLLNGAVLYVLVRLLLRHGNYANSKA